MKPNFEWRGEEMYLDNAATTMIDPEVVAVMQPYLEERYGNPETVYRLGREAHEAVELARNKIATLLGCTNEEVYFTSGGTESNNWAIKGFLFSKEKNNIVIGAVEHPSILEPANWLVSRGLASLYVAPVDDFGMVKLDAVESYLKEGKVGLVSIQYGNNEVGTIHPVKEIALLCKKYGALFHCDAVQAFGKVAFDVDDIGFDMVSISAHKIHGPMGIGALYIRKGTSVEPLMHGGGQEGGMRSGTHSVHNIVGFGKAVELAETAIKKDMSRLYKVIDSAAGDMALRLGAQRNGHPTLRLPNILNVTIPGFDASLACGILCTKYGICVSSGAACHTKIRGSHVLEAMGKKNVVGSTLRISLSRYNTENEVRMLTSRLQAVMVEAKSRSLI